MLQTALQPVSQPRLQPFVPSQKCFAFSQIHTSSLRTDTLTSREQEVLELIAQGLTNKHIAKHLEISPRTVSTHLTRIYGKLWVKNRTAAVVKAARLGLV